jgi:hypothetical protein
MGLIYDNNSSQQDSNTTKQPLVGISGEPPHSGEADSPPKLRRRSLSDLQGEDAGSASEPEARPRRRRLARALQDQAAEPQPPAPPAGGGLIDLNTLPDTQERCDDTTAPNVTDAEPVLETPQPQTKSGRRRLAAPGPRTAVEEPPQTEPAPNGLIDLGPSAGNEVPTTRSGRSRLAVSEPVPDQPEPAPNPGRLRLSEAAPQAEVAEPRAKAHRPRLGDPKTAPVSQTDKSRPLDPARVQQVIAELRAKQNAPLALLAGILTAAAGAALWVLVTDMTSFQLGYMAPVTGLLVGVTVRFSGRGVTKAFGWLGAALSLLGCLLGNFLTNCVFIARETDLTTAKVLAHLADNLTAGLGLMVAVHPVDLVLCAVGIYVGYRLSFRRLTEARIRRFA